MVDLDERGEPPVFICYSRVDEASMRDLVTHLAERGIGTWVDDAIRPSANWRDELSAAIQEARILLFLLSESSAESRVCLQEIDFALDCGTPILVVALAQLELPATLAFRLGSQQHIQPTGHRDAGFADQVIDAIDLALRPESKNPPSPIPPKRESSVGEILVTTGLSQTSVDGRGDRLIAAICRYVIWNGGAFRALRMRSDTSIDEGYIVEIDLQVDGEFVIAWQLMDASSHQILWSRQHREPAETFARKEARIAEMIAEGVIGEVRRHRRTQDNSPSRLSYWDLILKSDYYQGRDSETIGRQRSQLEVAISRYPTLGPAHAAKADLMAWELLNGVSSNPNTVVEEARAEASTALDLDPDNPYVLVHCGSAHGRLGDYERGTALCRRAYSVAPTAASKEALARSLCFAGQPEEAISLLEEILETMPAGQIFQFGKLVVPLVQANRLEEAIEYSAQSIIHFPKVHFVLMMHANLLGWADAPEAMQILNEAASLMPDVPWKRVLMGTERTYGRTAEQRRLLTGGIRRLLGETSF